MENETRKRGAPPGNKFRALKPGQERKKPPPTIVIRTTNNYPGIKERLQKYADEKSGGKVGPVLLQVIDEFLVGKGY